MIPETKRPTDDFPWLMPEVIRWLEAALRPSWTVLETGMGGSTVFFAQRVRRVISFESNPQWYDKTLRVLQRQRIENVDARFRQHYPVAGLADLPDIDLAFVDGRGRVRSVIDAMPHVRPGGWLLLDDSYRERYDEAQRTLDVLWCGGEKIVFSDGTDQTTAWRKP